jgi:DNA-binding response OmpR family regulator
MAGRMRILLAEDERVISRLINQVLTVAGHEVIGVPSCREAISLLQNEPFDLVLLDLNLSDGDGFRVAEAVRSRPDLKTPVLLMTGDHGLDNDDPRTGCVAGILWKPFELDELERAVNRLVA